MPVLPVDFISNNASSQGVITVTLLIDGSPIPVSVPVYSVDVWHELNRISRAKIVVLDGNVAEETFEISEKEWFIPGKEIEIQLGPPSDQQRVFKGIVTGQSIKIRANGNSILTVDCADHAVKLTAVPKSRYFYDSTESDVFETIINEYENLVSEVESTTIELKEILQFQATDWDFILNRADINGLFCVTEGGKISIKSPDFTQESQAVLSYGNNLLEIDAQLKSSNQVDGVKSVSWDYSKTESTETDAVSNSPVEPGNLSSESIADSLNNGEWVLRTGGKVPSEVLQKWCNAKLMKHELAKVRGRAQIRGISDIKPGGVVTLRGIGDRFNGNVFVSGVKHEFYKGEWLTDVQLGLSSKWFSEQFSVSSPPAAGIVPSISGLQIGVVTDIEDPEGDERLRVRLPMVDSNGQGIWARLATVGAGENRGVVIRPEIGDEVVVGFIHEDPNQPLILGSLNSANNPAPLSANNDNNEKGWVSRGGIKIILDDEKPSLLIQMPSGKKISVNDDEGKITLEDENHNSILMDSEGITLNSSNKISIKSNGDFSVEAANINAKAQAGLKAQGSGSAEISSSGSTSVKGSIVQIN